MTIRRQFVDLEEISKADKADVILTALPEKGHADRTTVPIKESAKPLFKGLVWDREDFFMYDPAIEFKLADPMDNPNKFLSVLDRVKKTFAIEPELDNPTDGYPLASYHLHISTVEERDLERFVATYNRLLAMRLIDRGLVKSALHPKFGFDSVLHYKGLVGMHGDNWFEAREHVYSARKELAELLELLDQKEEVALRRMGREIQSLLTDENIKRILKKHPIFLIETIADSSFWLDAGEKGVYLTDPRIVARVKRAMHASHLNPLLVLNVVIALNEERGYSPQADPALKGIRDVIVKNLSEPFLDKIVKKSGFLELARFINTVLADGLPPSMENLLVDTVIRYLRKGKTSGHYTDSIRALWNFSDSYPAATKYLTNALLGEDSKPDDPPVEDLILRSERAVLSYSSRAAVYKHLFEVGAFDSESRLGRIFLRRLSCIHIEAYNEIVKRMFLFASLLPVEDANKIKQFLEGSESARNASNHSKESSCKEVERLGD